MIAAPPTSQHGSRIFNDEDYEEERHIKTSMYNYSANYLACDITYYP